MSPESRKKTRLISVRKLICEECGNKRAVVVLKGRGLCKNCLNPEPSEEYLEEQFGYWTRQISSASFSPTLDGSAVRSKR
jgi:hypothetical protein